MKCYITLIKMILLLILLKIDLQQYKMALHSYLKTIIERKIFEEEILPLIGKND